MKFTMVPAWLIAWGSTMVIISNVTVTKWPLFVIQLFISMLMGIFFIAYGSNYATKLVYKIFPDKKPKDAVKNDDELTDTTPVSDHD